MIDPTDITNYRLTHNELEERILFWVFAAGHNAKSTARGVDKFLKSVKFWYDKSHFENIRHVAIQCGWDKIRHFLSQSGLGCWRLKTRTVQELVTNDLNLHECTVDDLEKIYGIGPKTARCFILHSRKGARVAGLDTHVLKFLKESGLDVPKSTPTGKKYKVLEREFLRLCDEAGKSPADYDLEIWNRYAGHK